MSLRSHLLGNFLGQFWIALMGFAFVPLYLRHLGAEAYGVVAFVATLQAWASLLDMGMTPVAGREMGFVVGGQHATDRGRRVVVSFETVFLALGSLLALLGVFAAPWLADHWLHASSLPPRQISTVLQLAGLLVATRLLIALYRGALLGLQDVQVFNLAAALFATVRAAGAVGVIVWLSPTLFAFVAFQLALTIAEAVFYAWRLRHLLPAQGLRVPWIDVIELKRLWKLAGGAALTSLLAVALTQSDKLILSRLLPLPAFTAYFLAATLAGVLLLAVGPVAASAFPKLSELNARQDEAALSDAYHFYCQWVSVLVFPPTFVLMFYSEPVLMFWTRDPLVTAQATPVVGLLAAGTALNALMQVPASLQISQGRVRLGVLANALACLLLLPAILVVVPMAGAMGAAWIWLVLNVGYVLVVMPLVHRHVLHGEVGRWYRRDVALPACSAFLAVAIVYLFIPTQGNTQAFGVAVLSGFAGLLAALWGSGLVSRLKVFARPVGGH